MGTDRYAYSSRLRRMNPAAKAFLSLLALTLCLIFGGIAPGVFTLLFMGFLTVFWGKIPFRVFFRFLLVPLTFLLLGCLTIGIGLHPADTPVVAAVPVGGKLLGFTQGSILQMLSICSKSMGVMAAVYWIANHYGPDYMYYGIGVGWTVGFTLSVAYYLSGRWKRMSLADRE